MRAWIREKLGWDWRVAPILALFFTGAILADLGAGLWIAYAFAASGIFLTVLYARSFR